MLRLFQGIINGDIGLVDGLRVTAFTSYLQYHLDTGQEIDVLLEGEQAVIMVQCKNYAPNYLYKLTGQMLEEFVDKATRLHAARFSGKELRLGFFSKHGFEPQMESYLRQRHIVYRL